MEFEQTDKFRFVWRVDLRFKKETQKSYEWQTPRQKFTDEKQKVYRLLKMVYKPQNSGVVLVASVRIINRTLPTGHSSYIG